MASFNLSTHPVVPETKSLTESSGFRNIGINAFISEEQNVKEADPVADAEVSGTSIDQASAKPAMAPEKSIQRNKVICLECGQAFKMLSPKHLRSHDLTPKEYRKKHGFSLRQPLCAKSLSERRSKSGKKRGLPENLRKAIAARTKGKKKK